MLGGMTEGIRICRDRRADGGGILLPFEQAMCNGGHPDRVATDGSAPNRSIRVEMHFESPRLAAAVRAV